jgi:hypothetical protein
MCDPHADHARSYRVTFRKSAGKIERVRESSQNLGERNKSQAAGRVGFVHGVRVHFGGSTDALSGRRSHVKRRLKRSETQSTD